LPPSSYYLSHFLPSPSYCFSVLPLSFSSSCIAVEVLCCKPESRGFETQWGEWIVSNLPNPCGCTRPWGSLSL
jgi:hypothetical protein